uniref:SCP domain-containing protein n=1 Tax=Stomoxys calcitrans TaxID=35570 RepID=A0A1I8PHL3_STOCA
MKISHFKQSLLIISSLVLLTVRVPLIESRGQWAVQTYGKIDVLYYFDASVNASTKAAHGLCKEKEMLFGMQSTAIPYNILPSAKYWAPHKKGMNVLNVNCTRADNYGKGKETNCQHEFAEGANYSQSNLVPGGIICAATLTRAYIIRRNISELHYTLPPIPKYCHPQSSLKATSNEVACVLVINKDN